jgi:hypothetical protein
MVCASAISCPLLVGPRRRGREELKANHTPPHSASTCTLNITTHALRSTASKDNDSSTAEGTDTTARDAPWMWLINTQSLALEYFADPVTEGVAYAILSHTWDGYHEVSFQEFAYLNTAREKAGFAKIARTCKLARENGLKYAWVDTCCIDKSSSAELSEAINSMFAWYKGAEVCYVYLSDLTEAPFPRSIKGLVRITAEQIAESPRLREEIRQSNFARCRWFRRGWTLQELIAPANVVFYDAGWRVIETKSGFRHGLEVVTGIEARILVGDADIQRESVWKRMSWAAGRKTSRVEDMAYCLLGLFDVNMPLIYGEGYRAFQRLQEEITRKDGDVSILAWQSSDGGDDGDEGDGSSMPPPEHRPPVYRLASKPPRYRGAFAWAPSEFLSRDLAPKLVTIGRFSQHTNYVALPPKAELTDRSGVLLRYVAVDTALPEDPRHMWLSIPFLHGTIYRPVEKTEHGFAFRSTPITRQDDLPQSRIFRVANELRVVGQHMAQASDARRTRRIYLSVDSYMANAGRTLAWPEHRWEPNPHCFLYDLSDLRQLRASGPSVLGATVLRGTVFLRDLSKLGDALPFEIVCILASLPSTPQVRLAGQRTDETVQVGEGGGLPRLAAICFVKHTKERLSESIFDAMENTDETGLYRVVRHAQYTIQSMSRLPDFEERVKSGYTVTVHVPYRNSVYPMVVRCTYDETPEEADDDAMEVDDDEERDKEDIFWRVRVQVKGEGQQDEEEVSFRHSRMFGLRNLTQKMSQTSHVDAGSSSSSLSSLRAPSRSFTKMS